MADYHFERAESFEKLVKAHDRWMADYNAQRHWAHEHREDGRRTPEAVLGFYTGVRYHPDDLKRAFFETRYVRVLDALTLGVNCELTIPSDPRTSAEVDRDGH